MENPTNQNLNNQTPVPNLEPPVSTNQPALPSNPTPGVPIKKSPIQSMKDIYGNMKNKKVFKLLVVLFAIMLFIIISGTIYSIFKNSGKKNPIIVVPSPQPTTVLKLTEESKKSQTTLEILKDKVSKLDSNQKHLTPPTIDFDISF